VRRSIHQRAGGVGGLLLVLDGVSTSYHQNSSPDPTDDDYVDSRAPTVHVSPSGPPAAVSRGSRQSPWVPLMDRMGNVTGYKKAQTTLPAGQLDAVYDYDAFGQEVRSTGPAADVVPYYFSTKFTDATGLVYYGYRWYDAQKGRWLSGDPIGEAGGVNLLAMVGNNAVIVVDYLGLCKRREGGVKGAQGHHIIPFSIFARCRDGSAICTFLDGPANLMRDDNWNKHGSQPFNGVAHKLYTDLVAKLLARTLGEKDICCLDENDLKKLIKSVKDAGGDIKKFLDGVDDEIKKARRVAQEKLEREAREKLQKEGLEKGEGLLSKAGKRVGKKIPFLGLGLMLKGAYDGWQEDGFWGAVGGALW
jgi:RHS repeat-associated protein